MASRIPQILIAFAIAGGTRSVRPGSDFIFIHHCPGSDADHHAWVKLAAVAKTSCDTVMAEMMGRAAGQDKWTDPHNGGTYDITGLYPFHRWTGKLQKKGLQKSPPINDLGIDFVAVKRPMPWDKDISWSKGGLQQLATQRITPPQVGKSVRFTDKQKFTLTPLHGDRECHIRACSESQGTSFKDFSTNYCDLRNLYCSKSEVCTNVNGKDFETEETEVEHSKWAGTDFSKCIVKRKSE